MTITVSFPVAGHLKKTKISTKMLLDNAGKAGQSGAAILGSTGTAILGSTGKAIVETPGKAILGKTGEVISGATGNAGKTLISGRTLLDQPAKHLTGVFEHAAKETKRTLTDHPFKAEISGLTKSKKTWGQSGDKNLSETESSERGGQRYDIYTRPAVKKPLKP